MLISNPVWGTKWDAYFSLGINTQRKILEQYQDFKTSIFAQAKEIAMGFDDGELTIIKSQ
ncbi:hypothetical protein [Sphingobacterium sp.]|uniref:hypothetical protein n=1 Tax=Sphingobacterium sp. TaxID=341027 RepID=UPI00258CBE73|nr:hypothetical protein [Sphingobacterium sp.]WET68861.1 MAG: hypothetical protein P0Y57_23770 [Sphingobacterium sp.]